LLRLRGLFEYDHSDSKKESWRSVLPYFFSTTGFREFQDREVSTGGDAVQKQLACLDLQDAIDEAYFEWEYLSQQDPTGNEWEDQNIQRRKDYLVRRIKLARYFIQTGIKPEWMVLNFLPVLPPELRPMFQLVGGELVTSDLNELYRKILYRNNMLIEFLVKNEYTPEGLIICQKRLVQEAVDSLLDNGIRGQPTKDSHNRSYKSFSDLLEGKEGRFRENLLGKRVDYSGRSVIVVGPSLSLHQCGLPREIALELFQPFIIRGLIGRYFARNLRAAKDIIRNKEPVIWKILWEVMKGHPVLLNRAPTLHRLGVQAFQPILMDGRAIRLHPLVCAGFNADFDGDQMAVHIPLSLEAQTEARFLMLSNTNLVSPATGDPIAIPTQDMLLGLYVLTLEDYRGIYNKKLYSFHQNNQNNSRLFKLPYFTNYDGVLKANECGQINLHSSLWIRWNFSLGIINLINREFPVEIQYDSSGISIHVYDTYQIRRNRKKEILSTYVLTTTGRILFNQQIEEALQGSLKVSPYREKSRPVIPV